MSGKSNKKNKVPSRLSQGLTKYQRQWFKEFIYAVTSGKPELISDIKSTLNDYFRAEKRHLWLAYTDAEVELPGRLRLSSEATVPLENKGRLPKSLLCIIRVDEAAPDEIEVLFVTDRERNSETTVTLSALQWREICAKFTIYINTEDIEQRKGTTYAKRYDERERNAIRRHLGLSVSISTKPPKLIAYSTADVTGWNWERISPTGKHDTTDAGLFALRDEERKRRSEHYYTEWSPAGIKSRRAR